MITKKAILDTIDYLYKIPHLGTHPISLYPITMSINSFNKIENNITNIIRNIGTSNKDSSGIFFLFGNIYMIQSNQNIYDFEIYWHGYRSDILTNEERIIKSIIE